MGNCVLDEARPARYEDRHICIEFPQRMVRIDSRAVHLTGMEFALLAFLVRSAGQIVHRRRLLSDVWGYNEGSHSRTVDVDIVRLRKKLAPYSQEYDRVPGRIPFSINVRWRVRRRDSLPNEAPRALFVRP